MQGQIKGILNGVVVIVIILGSQGIWALRVPFPNSASGN